MNTGLDCDRLGGVGQGSSTVNYVRTHAGTYARAEAAAPHVICFTLVTVLLDDGQCAGSGAFRRSAVSIAPNPRSSGEQETPACGRRLTAIQIFGSKSGSNGVLPSCCDGLGIELNNRQDGRGRGKRGSGLWHHISPTADNAAYQAESQNILLSR